MKILFLALDINLGINRGDCIHAENLAASLIRAGNGVRMVVGMISDGFQLPGVDLSVRPEGGDLAVLSHVRKIARSFRPDVIYERRFSPKISASVAFLRRVPFVIEYNGIVEEEAAMQGRPMERSLRSRGKARMRAGLLRRASAIVTVTSGLQEFVVQEYRIPRTRVFVVENGVDPVLFQPAGQAESRAALGLPSRPLACYVGNLVRWQGLDGLLQSLHSVRAPLDLVLVGDGPDRPYLLQQAGELGILQRLHFAGEVRHGEVPRYISASDVCVAPFSSERNMRSGVSALKLYEYLACGRPVVVTAVPGATELVEAHGCGLVVPTGDPQSLAAAIDQVVADPRYGRAALRASEIVRSQHSWDRTARNVLGVLGGVVAT